MKKALIFLSLILTGCATNVTILGNTYPPVDENSVKVLINELPDCNYEQIGLIQTPLMWNQNAAIAKAKEKAAEIGADYIMASTYVNNLNDVSVNAIAYKCKN